MPDERESSWEFDIDGTHFYAEVSSGLVSVSTETIGPVTTQVGGSPPESIARMLAREILQGKK